MHHFSLAALLSKRGLSIRVEKERKGKERKLNKQAKKTRREDFFVKREALKWCCGNIMFR